jgi:CRISPR-associated protein Cas9/Csn1, subtype II/NMEMI
MVQKKFGDYYLGLDIGTDSVGWAVADKEYNILNFNGKAMWGVHLFDSGKTAEERRINRIARRRLERRKQRIEFLKEIFSDEINKVEPEFFERLAESRLIFEDRKHQSRNTLFNDAGFKDKDLFKKYPTIYHLRSGLMEQKEKTDIRLFYLACHHIIKYRGHFLFEGLSEGPIPKFEIVFEELITTLNLECGTNLNSKETDRSVQEVLLDKNLGISEKTKKLQSILVDEDFSGLIKELCKLLSGGTATLDNMFPGNDDDSGLGSLTFKNTDFDEILSKLELQIPEKLGILNRAKTIYDWALLSDYLKGQNSISKAKIETYNQHKSDLKLLKSILKSDSEKYSQVFKSEDIGSNYPSYSGMHRKNTEKTDVCSQSDFCKYLRISIFKKEFEDPVFCEKYADLVARIKDDTFMPKQTVKENSMFPNALHKYELEQILKNMELYYPFLNEKYEDGWTAKDKILKLCTFRIPYYVGPLNKNSDRSWLKREDGKITPWNFEKKVDLDKSAENFMANLIGNCTYLKKEPVVPKCSLMYQRYELYNELNTLKIDGERLFKIDIKLKEELVKDLFENQSKKVTEKTIETWLRKKCQYHKDNVVEISGIDSEIKSSLKSEKQLKEILGSPLNYEMSEDIVQIITVFGGDKSRMKSKLKKDYSGILKDEQIERLSKLTFKDWGRLSKRLLTEIYVIVDGEEMNLLTALEKTRYNLMELISIREFAKKIDEINGPVVANCRITYDLVEDLYVSPSVRRGIWRSLKIIEDILSITKHPPSKIFIETTRENQESKRTVSRKKDLIKKYEACKKESENINNQLNLLNETDEGRLRSKDLYAYYIQQGKCMYCGKKIDLNDLRNNNMYDLDHIHPRSLKADDSIHNNLVLVCKKHNQEKGKDYPLNSDWQKNMSSFWKSLKEKGFITKEKYERLIRNSSFEDDELSGFINRQLVETSQSVKAVAETLKRVFGEQADIVYVKANTVSDFRNGNNGFKSNETDESLKFVKCRSVNDYHHAKDAYLNIVVGNVYDTKFTKDYKNFIRTERNNYNLRRMFDSDVERNGVRAWTAGKNGTIETVQKYMRRNNILFTRFTSQKQGALFKVNPLKKGKGQLSLKKELPIEKYGGYDKVSGAYFLLVEHTKGKKTVRTIYPVLSYLIKNDTDNNELIRYMEEVDKLTNPKILIRKIPFSSTFEINGYRLHISGRTDDQCLYNSAEQLILSENDYVYCKKIENYVLKSKEMKESISAENYGITFEKNLSFYQTLSEKYGNSKYRVFFETVSKSLSEKSEIFETLSLNDQTKVLEQMLCGFRCNASVSNLEQIGLKIGRIRKSNNIGNFDSIKLIHQSPSGLFEYEIDFKNL